MKADCGIDGDGFGASRTGSVSVETLGRDVSDPFDVERGGDVRTGLETLVAFQLRLAQASSFSAFTKLANYQGLRPGYYAILEVIGANPGISQTEVSRLVGRDKTTLTPVLKYMDQNGLIERNVNPDDLRGRCLRLTRLGAEARHRLAECARIHDSNIDAILGEQDRVEALRILGKLIAGLEATMPIEQARPKGPVMMAVA